MNKIILLIVLLTSAHVKGQNIFIDKAGKVSFFSEARLENIEAVHHGVNAMLNTLTNEVVFIVPIRGFKFEKELMQEHFNEKYMESDKFPKATFKCSIIDSVSWSVPGTYHVSAKGILNLHGVDKEITESGVITVDGNRISLSSEFDIAVAEYGITIPKLLFENIADTVRVTLQSNFEPFQKK